VKSGNVVTNAERTPGYEDLLPKHETIRSYLLFVYVVLWSRPILTMKQRVVHSGEMPTMPT